MDISKEKNVSRMYYLDNLKVFLTTLVILHHLAIVFGGEGGFIITAPSSNIWVRLALTVFLALNQSYFMGVFFAISGYFSYKSIAKKGARKFIENKIKRLIIPALVYYGLVNPILVGLIDILYRKILFDDLIYKPGFGALWFVFALGSFDILYVIFFKDKPNKKNEIIFPNTRKWTKYIIVVGICAWIIRIIYPVGTGILDFQLGHFPQYIFAYGLGIVASANNWTEKIQSISIKKNSIDIFVLILMFFIGVAITEGVIGNIKPAFGGFNLIALLYSIWEQLMFIKCLSFLLSIFNKKYNYSNKLLGFATKSAYLAYIVHSSIIAIIIMILVPLKLKWYVLSTLSIFFSVVLSFIVARLIKTVISL